MKENNKKNLRKFVVTALLGAISVVLAYIEMPIGPFLKLDLSELPALIAAFAFGPIMGVIVELIKNGAHMFSTTTGFIGEIGNILIGCALVIPAGLLYKKNKTKKNAVIGCLLGTVLMALTGLIANYFLLLPLYEKFMPISEIIGMFENFIPFIKSKFDLVLFYIIPFNILKGGIVSIITILIYKRISRLIKDN